MNIQLLLKLILFPVYLAAWLYNAQTRYVKIPIHSGTLRVRLPRKERVN